MAALIVKHSNTRTINLPLFLTPAFATPAPARPVKPLTKSFSCSAIQADNRKRSRETNKKRGVSVIRRSGPRVPLSVAKYPLPKPVIDPARRAQFKTREDHGLWGFFNEGKEPMVSGEEEGSFGRSWTYEELSWKSFEDLHRLHWACVKELNRTLTREGEMTRTRAGYGSAEVKERIRTIRKTMSRIRIVLRDRHAAREEARSLLAQTSLEELLESRDDQPFDEARQDNILPEQQSGPQEPSTRVS